VEQSEERAARNESVFRTANERIAERRVDLAAVEGPTPFLCECEDPECTDIVLMSLLDYEGIRSDPVQFLVVPGHVTHGIATVHEGDGWVCVRKDGVSATISIDMDPRA
jgi:hypothetical protein